jgi:hypothetical protein
MISRIAALMPLLLITLWYILGCWTAARGSIPTMKWFRKTWVTVAMMSVPPLPPTTPASWPSCGNTTTVSKHKAAPVNEELKADATHTSACLEYDERRHGGQGPLPGSDEVGRRRRELVGGALLGHGEVVHLVVEHDARGRREHQRAEDVVHGGRHRHRVPVAVHHAEVAGAVVPQLVPPESHHRHKCEVLQSSEHRSCNPKKETSD